MSEHGTVGRHLPFFEVLAELNDRDPVWRAVSAGLVVLRLVDAWAEDGPAVVDAAGWGMRSVEAAIEEMPVGMPARRLLRGVVDALKESAQHDMHMVAPRLMAYARSLDLDAKWALAADVYETVIAHVHPIEESDAAIAAHLRLGFCRRSMGALGDAQRSYETASQLAEATDDLFGVLRGQIGSAAVAKARGNIPYAESLLDDAIEKAERYDLTDVHARALQDRADLAHLRGNYDLAVRLAYRALTRTTDPVNRDRLLGDIAGAFYMLGVRSAARDTYLIIEATAQEQYQRWVATINLMEIAAQDGSRPLFERYRRSLVGEPLPPALHAQYFLHVGTGLMALREFEPAVGAFERANELAQEYGFHQLRFAAEQAIAQAMSSVRVARVAEAVVPPGLEDVAASLGSLRREVTEPRGLRV